MDLMESGNKLLGVQSNSNGHLTATQNYLLMVDIGGSSPSLPMGVSLIGKARKTKMSVNIKEFIKRFLAATPTGIFGFKPIVVQIRNSESY